MCDIKSNVNMLLCWRGRGADMMSKGAPPKKNRKVTNMI